MGLAINLAGFIRPFPRVPLLGGGGVLVGWGISGQFLSQVGWLDRVPFLFLRTRTGRALKCFGFESKSMFFP